MKITICTGPIFPVPAVRGGAVQRLWEGLAGEFVKRGHEVTIFAREFPGQAREEFVEGIRYVRRGGYEQSTSIRRDLVQCLIYALKVARHMPPGDVVVTNDFWTPAILPWIGVNSGKVIASIARFPKRQFFLYKRCAAIAPVSRSVADGIVEQTPSVAGKVIVVPNCVDAAFLTPVARKRAGDARTPRILFVGRLHPEKGLEMLAQALRNMERGAGNAGTGMQHTADGIRSNSGGMGSGTIGTDRWGWECMLVGPVAQNEGGGGEAFAEKIREVTKGLPVQFHKPIYNPSELAAVYDAGDILVYPSVADTGEAMPLAPLEGMARGLVPVVSDLAAFREYLEPGVNGVVFDHRGENAAENLSRALQDLIGNLEKRAAMSAAARVTAEKFSPAAIADKYLQLFEKVVSGSLA